MTPLRVRISAMRIEPLEQRWAPATIVVTGTGDLVSVDGVVTLREAILSANGDANINADVVAGGAYGADTIAFNIPGPGPHTINVGAGGLPKLTDQDGVTIDGTTEPNFAGKPVIELNGAGAGAGIDGLAITSSNNVIKGLAINRFNGDGIDITLVSDDVSGNLIQGNFIGTDIAGTADLGNAGFGVRIDGGADNTIGGSAAGERNVISGNGEVGVGLLSAAGVRNVVQGNFLGTDVNGTADLGNSDDGVLIKDGASFNRIGGTAAGTGNLISGNNDSGIRIESQTSTSNVVQGNLIGTDVTGTLRLGNTEDGVVIVEGSENTIGGAAAGARNVISANDIGVKIADPDATGNVVQGNFIGTDIHGTVDIGNAGSGIVLTTGTSANTIGGTAAGARNVISGNDLYGVFFVRGNAGLALAEENVVQGNFIGTDFNGTADLGNTRDGILIDSGENNTIGGSAAGAGNLISGNGGRGISVKAEAADNCVEGNKVGTDAGGAKKLPNDQDGIGVEGGSNNTFGGLTPGAGNVISGNSGHGVSFALGAFGNLLIGNLIGLDLSGVAALGNSLAGVSIDDATANTIGGFNAGEANTIAGNAGAGVGITGSSSGIKLPGNSIYANGGLGIDLGLDGVTPNDTGDGDSGPNGLQNFPVITSARLTNGNLSIAGTLNSTANSPFTLLFYANQALDGTGFGEGRTIIGSTTTGTFGTGDGTFSVAFPLPSGAGVFVTALAINGLNFATSEFSAGVEAGGATITVTSAADTVAVDGVVTLREAILSANADANINADVAATGIYGRDTIRFAIGTGAQRILVAAGGLPELTDNDGVTINGTTQPGFAGKPLIEIDGSAAGPTGTNVDGLRIISSNNTIRGLVINRFGHDAIDIRGEDATGNLIAGNFIGTDLAGTADLGSAARGVVIIEGAANNTIGGTTAADRNVISGNFIGVGIEMEFGIQSTGNVVAGNFIGTDVSGTADLGNTLGIIISTFGNTVGGTSAGARNLISGNDGRAVVIVDAGNNLVAGNFIGTDVTGSAALGNSDGVAIEDGVGNTIGGTSVAARNVISANGGGVTINGADASGNLVAGNFIGTDVSGTVAFIGGTGVSIEEAPANTIGGTSAAARNVISGGGPGVEIRGEGATGNVVAGNFIGTDVHGTADLGNSGRGVFIRLDAAANTIGGGIAGAGNVISGNEGNGVEIIGSATTGNVVAGNFIGTDFTGTAALRNDGAGVLIFNAAATTIGGTSAGARNVISSNGIAGGEFSRERPGVEISGSAATGNVVAGNFIGTDVNGTADLGNSDDGVFISDASQNTVGGSSTGARNVISGNAGEGVEIAGSGATGNVVAGNYIGTDFNGTADLGNTSHGVRVFGAPSNTIGGASVGARNVISGNNQHGVVLDNSGASGNIVAGNIVGLDASGTADLGNHGTGVFLFGAPGNTIGGLSAGARNIISGNDRGIELDGTSARGNLIVGNFIGTDVTGTVIGEDENRLGNGEGILVADGQNNTIGGTTPAARNVISGNFNAGIGFAFVNDTLLATGNLIAGNFIGTDVNGTADLGNSGNGVQFNGSANTIGGTTAGAGNLISGNGGGISISGIGTSGNLVAGNFIGTDVSGTADLGNSQDGILIERASANTIGGTTAAARNVISGNGGDGVEIRHEEATGNVVLGNFIGVAANGGPLGNGGNGVLLFDGASANTVGGVNAGQANTIWNNGGAGIGITGSNTVGNKLPGNSIFANGGLGIDLGLDGVTLNDTDPGTGPNRGQNFPQLTAANATGNNLLVEGSLFSAPNTPYTILFFANTALDPTGHGEGQTLLGSANTSSGPDGTAPITASLTLPPGAGRLITALAINGTTFDTSEFSTAITVTSTPNIVTINGDRDRRNQNDAIRLAIDPNNPNLVQVFVNNTGPTPTETMDFTQISGIKVNGLGGKDTLTVDIGNGLINPPDGIVFDGGAGKDVLSLVGNAFGDVLDLATYTYTARGAGAVALDPDGPGVRDAMVVTYTGLEPVVVTSATVNAVFNLTAGNDKATLVKARLPALAGSLTLSGGTFETTTFFAPTGSLTIDAGAGTDSLVVAGEPIDLVGARLDLTAEKITIKTSLTAGDLTTSGDTLAVSGRRTIIATTGGITLDHVGGVKASGASFMALGPGAVVAITVGATQDVTVGGVKTSNGVFTSTGGGDFVAKGAIDAGTGDVTIDHGGHVTLAGDVTGGSFESAGINFTLARLKNLTTSDGGITIDHTGVVKAAGNLVVSSPGDSIDITAGVGRHDVVVGSAMTDGGGFSSTGGRHFTASGAIDTGGGEVSLVHVGKVSLGGDVTAEAFSSRGTSFTTGSGDDLVIGGALTLNHSAKMTIGGKLDAPGFSLSGGGNLVLAKTAELVFRVDVESPPASPLLGMDGGGDLILSKRSRITIEALGDAVDSVPGLYEIAKVIGGGAVINKGFLLNKTGPAAAAIGNVAAGADDLEVQFV